MNSNVINSNDLNTYLEVCFSNLDGLVPCRSFPEKGNSANKSAANRWVRVDSKMPLKISSFAKSCASFQSGCYVIPGVVDKSGQAGSRHIKSMQVLLIDIDNGNTEEKLQNLNAKLGEPTLIVESGGKTESGHSRLHVYWQLAKPAMQDDLSKLLELRYKIALAAEGDTHFKSAHQPIRVAGSIYCKNGACHLVKIRKYNAVKYKLSDLLERFGNLEKTQLVTSNESAYKPFEQILTTKVYSGANGADSKYNNLSRVAGYWIRRCFDGIISKQQALEEIYSYNLANITPPWSEERLQGVIDGLWKLQEQKNATSKCNGNPHTNIASYSLGSFLDDKSKIPADLIAPRILTAGGIFVFGGAPKVGKSDFLLSLFVHLAAGQEFLGLKPPRPLKIFYLQSEIGYHYLRERLQNMRLSSELKSTAQDNLLITSNIKLLLDNGGVELLAEHIINSCNHIPDIIAVDPIRNVFDGGKVAKENDNDSMMFFLQKRIELLRNKINPQAGMILVHHTKKLNTTQLEEDPFQGFSGASSLRGYYETGAILYKPDIAGLDGGTRKLIFELRNGPNIAPKLFAKKHGKWLLDDDATLGNRNNKGQVRKNSYKADLNTRIQKIVQILEEESLHSKLYQMKDFAETFCNYEGLGSMRFTYNDCSFAASKGIIKFFNNPQDYDLNIHLSQASAGIMCTANMQLKTAIDIVKIKPTHERINGKQTAILIDKKPTILEKNNAA